MTDRDTRRTHHLSARIPTGLMEQVELVRVRRRLRHGSDALVHVLDRGLEAIASERAKPDRLEAMVARIDDLTITMLAILNLVHDLDPEAVAETRAAILDKLTPRAPEEHPAIHGFRPRKADGEDRS